MSSFERMPSDSKVGALQHIALWNCFRRHPTYFLTIYVQAQSIKFVDMLSSIFDFSHIPEKMHEKASL